MPTIPLTKGFAAIIDDEDADLMAHRYWASVNGPRHVYAQRHTKLGVRKYLKRPLHREIGERVHGGPIPKGFDVDHINGDTLDNRRGNLRVVSHKRNMWNQHGAGRDSQTGVRGVRCKKGRWTAYICQGPKMRHLGTFDTMEAARAARLQAEHERLERHAA